MKTYVQIIAARGKAKRGDVPKEDSKESPESYDAVKDDALGELAEILELEGEAAEKFKAALGELVEACVCSHEDSEAKE